ncbi:MAG: phosphatidylglycerol---prolipoprotein diacylglyceryl transferase [Actinomycetota bacterium]|nr:phosphatidylglycerol---prolipoprotein diacylglyceryl transferase [Actinomycetota bacterium]
MLAALSYHPIVHVHIGPLSISPHGVGIAVGFILGARLMLPAAARRGITEDDVYSLLTRAAIGAIVGARVAYVINHVGDYSGHYLDMLKIWQGGISLLGGFAGAILLALPEMKKRRLSFWRVMDAAAPGMALGVIVGRIGDLIVADHLGKATHFFLGYKCPPLSVATASPCSGTGQPPNIPGLIVHQTALYDFILTIVLLGVLLWLRRQPRWDGFLIIFFGASSGIDRIVEDFLREDVRRFGLTGSQMSAIVVVILCLYILFFRHRAPKWGHWDERREPAMIDTSASEPTMAGPEPDGPPGPDREE